MSVQQESIMISIPPGVTENDRVTLRGKGHHMDISFQPGDLNIYFNIESSGQFNREGDDILSSVNVEFSTLILGGTINIKTIHGDKEIRVPPATQPGAYLKIRDFGVRSSGTSHGSHLAKVSALIPRLINDKQKTYLGRISKNVKRI